jgi:DNA-binding NarL/FixJ family response regulator
LQRPFHGRQPAPGRPGSPRRRALDRAGADGRLLVATSKALAAAAPAHQARTHPRLATLTQRELEVARLIADGASNKEVGRALDISERTVKAHAGAIFEKLGARDRLHLA